MRPRVVLAVWLAAVLGAGALAFPAARSTLAHLTDARTSTTPRAGSRGRGQDPRTPDQPAPTAPAAPGPSTPAGLRVPAGGVTTPAGYTLLGWSLMDRASGRLLGGSANAATMTNYTESMIKPWIAADYLSRAVKAGRVPSQADLDQLRDMIIHSDNDIASHYYDLDGQDAVVSRLNQVCGLRTTVGLSGWWSYTSMTPDDAVRYGECLADGRAAGAYTSNLLTWMREVTGGVADQPTGPDAHTGGGRWGIIDALPPALAAQTSIKNGWEPEIRGHEWHVNCLAILPGQVLTVMVRYPWTSPDGSYRDADNLARGADACREVAAQLLATPAG